MFGQGSFLIDPRNLTPEQIQRNREMLMAIMPNFGSAQYAGQGLAHLGAGIVMGVGNRRFNRAEEAGRAEARALIESLLGGGTAAGAGFNPGASGSGSTVAPSTRSVPAGSGGRATEAVASRAANPTGTGAPTTGLPFMLPATDPMEGDPRRGMFPNGARVIDDPTVYTTRMTGAALQGVSPELIDIIGNSAEQVMGPGATVTAASGVRPHSAGSQHSAGQALDFGVTAPMFDAQGRRLPAGMPGASGGERLDFASPEIYDMARLAVSDGASGIGIGPTYMGGDVFHMDTGRGGGNGAPNFGNTVRTWSDWNTTGPRGANAPGGAGDPAMGFQAELQAIRNARAVPTGGPVTATASARAPAPPAAQGGAPAPVSAAPAASGGSPSLPQLYAALANPWLSASERQAIAGMIAVQERNADPMRQLQMEQLQLQIEQMRNPQTGELPASVQALVLRAQMAGLQPGTPEYADFMLGAGGEGSTTVNVQNTMPGQNTFDEAFARQDAEALAQIDAAGMAAQRNISRIDMLQNLLDASPSGFGAALRLRAGEWGINTDGLSDLQAAQAIINSLVPEQRQPGSGPMSDADLALFQQSLPRLINTPEGNRQIINTMRAIAEYDAEGARIVQQIRSGALSRADGVAALQARANPLAQTRGEQGQIGPQGGSQVTPTAPEARETRGAPASLSVDSIRQMPLQDFAAVLGTMDFSTLSPEIRAALLARGRELGLME